MLQKARRGKEINRGVVDQHFSAKMKKAKGCKGLGVRSYMNTVLVTNKLNKRAGTGYHLSSDFFDSLQRAEKVFIYLSRGFSQVNSTWKKWTSTQCCNRLDNKKFHVFLRFPQRLKLSSLPFAAVHVAASTKDLRLNFFTMIMFWAVLTHVLQKEWQPCR